MLSEQVMQKSWKDALTKKMTCCWSCLGEVVVRRLVPQDMVPIGRSTDKSTHARTARTYRCRSPFVPLLLVVCRRIHNALGAKFSEFHTICDLFT
jgi:hypothetical protein